MHDAGTGRELWRAAEHSDTAAQVVVTPDGRTAISSGHDGKVIWWDVASGKVVRSVQNPRHSVDVLALSQTSPSEAASRREMTVLLADALQGLPEDEAEILWLYHVDGLSFSSIGVRLGLNRKVVRAIWTRGLKNLRRQIDPEP